MTAEEMGKGSYTKNVLEGVTSNTHPGSCHQVLYLPLRVCNPPRPSSGFAPTFPSPTAYNIQGPMARINEPTYTVGAKTTYTHFKKGKHYIKIVILYSDNRR